MGEVVRELQVSLVYWTVFLLPSDPDETEDVEN